MISSFATGYTFIRKPVRHDEQLKQMLQDEDKFGVTQKME
jgi:hypothetical protein